MRASKKGTAGKAAAKTRENPQQEARGAGTVDKKALEAQAASERPQRRVVESPRVTLTYAEPASMSPEAKTECARWLRKQADKLENFGHEWYPNTEFRFPPEPV